MIKNFTNQHVSNVLEKSSSFDCSTFFILFSMSSNIGDKRSLSLKLKSKVENYRVLLTTLKASPGKVSLTVDETQQLPDIEKTDSRAESFCLKNEKKYW